jgi:Integrase core domain
MDLWAYQNGVKIDFSRPGKPTDNAFVELFNGTFRAECLNAHRFGTLTETRQLIEAWRQEYNGSRPHRSLGERTPSEFANLNQPETNSRLGAKRLGHPTTRYTNIPLGTKDRSGQYGIHLSANSNNLEGRGSPRTVSPCPLVG